MPSKRVSPREGVGPKLPWHHARSQCMNILDTARRGRGAVAMVRLGMLFKGVIYGYGKGKINIITITLTIAIIPLLPHMISCRYLAADATNARGRVRGSFVIGVFTPGHTPLLFVAPSFLTLVVWKRATTDNGGPNGPEAMRALTGKQQQRQQQRQQVMNKDMKDNVMIIDGGKSPARDSPPAARN